MIGRKGVCERHRATLLDFVDRREAGPDGGAALDHLDRCEACRRQLEATAVSIAWLRRLRSELGVAEPPEATWSQLRSRLERPATPAWRSRGPVAGLMVAAWIVVGLTVPTAVGPRPIGPFEERDLAVAATVTFDRVDLQVELLFARVRPTAVSRDAGTDAPTGWRVLPDGGRFLADEIGTTSPGVASLRARQLTLT